MEKTVEWTTRAAELFDPESLLQLADWHEKGTNVALDPDKSERYRYLAYLNRGGVAFNDGRFSEALPDIKKASESKRASSDTFNNLGMCYGKLARWDEAVKAYTRSIELGLNDEGVTGVVLDLLEALACAERPEQMEEFLQNIQKKGWTLPMERPEAAELNALFHGYRAIGLRMGGKDASEAERALRQYTSKPDFKISASTWEWAELNNWLKTTKLAPDRKAAVEKIAAELQGTAKNP